MRHMSGGDLMHLRRFAVAFLVIEKNIGAKGL